jgi:peptide/nickel transport system substrate-binding protein
MRIRRTWTTIATLLLAAGVLAGCGGGGGDSGGAAVAGGTATWAEPAGAGPTWIFPFVDAEHNSIANGPQFENLMYRPLYWYGDGDQVQLNPKLSLAAPPTYQANGTKVVIDLKSYTWSNGEKLTTANLMFWLNMMKAEKNNWAGYTPGEFPDNMTSAQITGPAQVTLTLDHTYSSEWYTDDNLSQITPMPLAWDKTSDSAAAGSGGCSTSIAKCAAVYQYLFTKSKSQSTYATDPLWQVVDGPWRLKAFSSDGNVTFVPNPKYSGPDKPRLAAFEELPFTSDAATYNVLRSGHTLNVGLVPSEDLPARTDADSAPVPSHNPLGSSYQLAPQYTWGWHYMVTNMANPTVGVLFKQLYVRQALQMTIDQDTDDKVAWRGYAVPTVGPVPVVPKTKWASPNQHGEGAYPFDVAKAKGLLTSHGWTDNGGTMTCTSPGTGPAQCGAGIAANQRLEVTVEYATTYAATGQTMQQWKSDAEGAGITIDLKPAQFNTVIADATSCPQKASTCDWQIALWGSEVYNTDPSGDGLFLPGSSINYQSYNDPKMTALVNKTLTSGDISDFYAFSDYAAEQLPGALNVPNRYQILAVSSNLHGVTPFSPLQVITPEDWYFTK